MRGWDPAIIKINVFVAKFESKKKNIKWKLKLQRTKVSILIIKSVLNLMGLDFPQPLNILLIQLQAALN